MLHSQPGRTGPRGPHATASDILNSEVSVPVVADKDGPELPTVCVRETGTGPFRYVVVDVPAGVHPASLATALRTLPIVCEFVDVADTAGSRSCTELRFRVHEEHSGARRPRLGEDSPGTAAESLAGGAR